MHLVQCTICIYRKYILLRTAAVSVVHAALFVLLCINQVEQLREDNRKREFMMNKQLERQQAQIARNVRLSAAELQED